MQNDQNDTYIDSHLGDVLMRPLSTREILEQAHDLLMPPGAWLSQEWWDLSGITPTTNNPVAGVAACSVGAMMLAKCLDPFDLDQEALGQVTWNDYVQVDPAFGRALKLLAFQIMDNFPDWFSDYRETHLSDQAERLVALDPDDFSYDVFANMIVKWNDDDGREAGDVLLVFEQATKAAITADEMA